MHAVDGRQTELPGFFLDLTVYGIDLKLSQLPCALEQKNSNEFSSRSFPPKVADDLIAAVQAQGRGLRDVKPDRRTSTLTAPGRTDSVDLWAKASEIVRTVLEHPAEQFEFLCRKRSKWFGFIHRCNPYFSLD